MIPLFASPHLGFKKKIKIGPCDSDCAPKANNCQEAGDITVLMSTWPTQEAGLFLASI